MPLVMAGPIYRHHGQHGTNNVAGFISYQAYAGGNPELGNRIEGFVCGDLKKTLSHGEAGYVHAGGLVAVA